jgi:hypothetical protein
MLRKILIALAALVVILIVTAIYVSHRAMREFAGTKQATQQQLQPGVVKGANQFGKREFYNTSGLGDISEILVGWPADLEGAALTIVGNEAAHFLDASVRLLKEVRFSTNVFCALDVSRLSEKGDFGFLTRQQSWGCPVILFDSQGQKRWSYSAGFLGGVDDSISLDVDGGATPAVVVGLNGGGGLVLLNSEGKRVWRKPEGNVWHVEALVTTDGRKQILHSNAQGQLLVRNLSGEIIARYLPDRYVSDFTVTRWESGAQPDHILIPIREDNDPARKPELWVLDAAGKTVAQLEVPAGQELTQHVKGTPVHFERNGDYFSVLFSDAVSSRSILVLYDEQRRIAYQEILGESCLGIAALPGEAGERLLVGCSGKVFEYSPVRRGG